MPNCFHENNATNIHYHGLHVDQGAHADSVFVTLYPEGQYNPPPISDCVSIGQHAYSFDLPSSHPGGTFWYHPHKHGSATLQSANGMSGAIIIEDNFSADPAFKGQLEDYTMVLQVIRDNINRPNSGAGGGGPPSPTQVRVNGVLNPTINIKQGQVQRWRFVNATWSDQTDFTVHFDPNSVEIYLLAMDGYFIPNDRWQKMQPLEYFYIAPGNRVDMLVKGIKEGVTPFRTTPIISALSPRGGTRSPSGAPPTPSTLPTAALSPAPTATGIISPTEVISPTEAISPTAVISPTVTTTPTVAPPQTTALLSVNVQGESDVEMDLPAALPPLGKDQLPIPDTEIVDTKTLKFTIETGSIGGAPGEAPKYLIGVNDQPGTQFDPNVVNECVEVDTAEEWTVENYTSVGHPFHIHLNPFFITDYYDPNDPPNPPEYPHGRIMQFNDPVGLWQDTIIIPAVDKNNPQNPGKVTFRHRFPDITGTFVLHCHVLGHEDRGFMHVVQVHAKGEACQALSCPHAHQ
jgi:FtsP/CotA-like multicopper oxidase with cupredoxin domain